MAAIPRKAVKILREVQKRILKDPSSYRQDEFHCGTAMCIAGHIVDVTAKDYTTVKEPGNTGRDLCLPASVGNEVVAVVKGKAYTGASWEEEATCALGLDDVGDLFGVPDYVDSEFDNEEDWSGTWPYKFAKAFHKARTRSEKAQVAVARIEHFIKTGD